MMGGGKSGQGRSRVGIRCRTRAEGSGGLTGTFARDIPVPRRVRKGADRSRRGLLGAGTWRGGGASVRVGLKGAQDVGDRSTEGMG